MSQPLNDWLHYLETLDPHKIQLGLERIAVVARKLFVAPQSRDRQGAAAVLKFNCPVITVTGTNGKGSCVAFLENILVAAGYKVGAYTSPHLFKFNERIRINKKEIDDESLCAAFAVIEKAREDIPLTYFEFTTLAALKIFQEADLDILILEVGLGGRLDAVNIIDADIAVITTIGIDHTDWLGDTRESITAEKAGIFRAGKFAVCGDFEPPANIFNLAESLGTKLFTINKDFSYEKFADSWSWRSNEVELNNLPLPHLELQNAATALMVLQLLGIAPPDAKSTHRPPPLRGFPLKNIVVLLPRRGNFPLEAIKNGLETAVLPGRFQKKGQTIFDVAHNPAAATWLAKKLAEEKNNGRTLAVVGMLADKDILGTLGVMSSVVDEWYVGSLSGPRGTKSEFLITKLAQLGINQCYNYHFIKEAYEAALKRAKANDRIIVFGSFHTVAEIKLAQGDFSWK